MWTGMATGLPAENPELQIVLAQSKHQSVLIKGPTPRDNLVKCEYRMASSSSCSPISAEPPIFPGVCGCCATSAPQRVCPVQTFRLVSSGRVARPRERALRHIDQLPAGATRAHRSPFPYVRSDWTSTPWRRHSASSPFTTRAGTCFISSPLALASLAFVGRAFRALGCGRVDASPQFRRIGNGATAAPPLLP